jgi:ribosomal protein L17
MGSRRRLISIIVVAVALLGACGSDAKPSATPAASSADTASVDRSTFAGAVCASITSWMNRLVDTTNSFSNDSPDLSVAARRERYAAAFDGLTKLMDELHTDLTQVPTVGTTQADADAIRAELDKAIELVKTQIAGNKDQARGLSDDDYTFQAVNEGHLFTGTEKALSTVLKALNEQGRAHTIPELEGTCGRR